jgi:DNA polymerase III subunit beta
MKIECLKEKLTHAVVTSHRLTGKNLTLPVLSCILLQAKDNELTVRATNLDVGIEIRFPVKVIEDGTVAVPGAILSNFITSLQDEKSIKLEVIDGNLYVSTNLNSTIIKSMPFEDFPTIPDVPADKKFTVPAKDFVKGLKSVWYSSSTSSIKPELSSVYVYADDEDMVFAATDSFRLAEKKVKLKKGKDFGSILIPFKNVPEIVRVFENVSDDIEIHLTKNQASFKHNGVYMVSRVIDGVFPDYRQIIPKEAKTEVILLKQDFINSLKLSNIFGDKFNQLNIRALPSTKLFELKTKNNDIGENVNKLQASLTGDDVEINFNYKYITDCFQSIDSDSVALDFNGLSRPMIIRGVSDKTFTYLVMPMNK